MRPVQPAMTDAEFHQRIQCILQEYLHHGDTNDVVVSRLLTHYLTPHAYNELIHFLTVMRDMESCLHKEGW